MLVQFTICSAVMCFYEEQLYPEKIINLFTS